MPLPKILVADDCQSIRLTVQRILVNAGYEVVLANNGIEALEMLSEQPALIVLDIKMPGLDGYGVCEALRSCAPTRQLPVVFLTSVESKALELLGDEYGAYLKKPVCKDELLSVVESQLNRTAEQV